METQGIKASLRAIAQVLYLKDYGDMVSVERINKTLNELALLRIEAFNQEVTRELENALSL